MEKHPLISIIIPIYNVAPYIERCLQSVYHQSYCHLEVILVDDCGCDDSMAIAGRFCTLHQLDWKIIAHQTNRGLSAARNTGVRNATGDYLFFLDSDDLLPVDSMLSFVRYLNKHGDADFLIGDYEVDGCFKKRTLDIGGKIDGNDSVFNLLVRGKWYMMAWGKLIARDFFFRNKLWFAEGRLHEDLLFSFKLALHADSLIALPEYVYQYIIHDNSITTNKKQKNFTDSFWIIEQKLRLGKGRGLSFERYILSALYSFVYEVRFSKLPIYKKYIFYRWPRHLLNNELIRHEDCKGKIIWLLLNHSPIFIHIFCSFHRLFHGRNIK